MSTDAANPRDDADTNPQARAIALFSSTNFGKSLFWSTADMFCLVYATDTLGMNPALAGLIILFTLIWDAISDPIVGSVVDRSALLGTQYGATIRIIAPIGAIFLILTFCAHLMISALQTMVFVGALFLFRTAFTLVDIPDNALFARVARHKQIRISGATFRKLMATAGAVAISLSSGWVFSGSFSSSEATRILTVAGIAGVFGVIAFFIGTASVKPWDKSRTDGSRQDLNSSVILLLKNTNLVALALHIFLSTLGMAFFMASLVYHARFVMGKNEWFAAAMTVFLIAQAIGVVAWGYIANASSSPRAIMKASALSMLAIVLFFCAGNTTLLIGACGVFGFSAGGLNALRWAIAPHVIDSVEQSTFRRYEAGAMALLSLSVKIAIGTASLLLGVVLFAFDYEAGNLASDNQAAAFRIVVAVVVLVSIALGMLPIGRKEFRET